MSKKNLDAILRSFMSGFSLSFGGAVFLSLLDTNKLAGAFLFSIGLFVILNFGFFLFTGKVGYIVENKPSYIGTVALIWAGNFIGAFFAATLLLATRYGATLQATARMLCEIKNADSPLSLTILGFFCGILMFIAADGFKILESPIMKLFAVVMPVTVFIMCGFEHSIANMVYFSLAGWSLESFVSLLWITLGNALGGMLIPLVRKFFLAN